MKACLSNTAGFLLVEKSSGRGLVGGARNTRAVRKSTPVYRQMTFYVFLRCYNLWCGSDRVPFAGTIQRMDAGERWIQMMFGDDVILFNYTTCERYGCDDQVPTEQLL